MNRLQIQKPLSRRGFFMLEKLWCRFWCRFVPDLLIWIQEVPEHAQEECEGGARRLEKEPDSEIWWIRYYIDGRERR
jgi:hypothetical protein